MNEHRDNYAPERVFLKACHPDSPNQNCSWEVTKDRQNSVEYVRARQTSDGKWCATEKSIRQRGWVMRNDTPVEIEFEHGFSLTDGFPYCHEIGTWIPLSPFPAPNEEALIVSYLHSLDAAIREHQTAIQVIVGRKQKLQDRLYEMAVERNRQ